MTCCPKVSKTHGHTDICPRKIFQNPRKILTFECGTCKTGTFSYFLHILTKFFEMLYVFIAISVHNSVQNVVKLNSDRAKKITFRRSGSRKFGNDFFSSPKPDYWKLRLHTKYPLRHFEYLIVSLSTPLCKCARSAQGSKKSCHVRTLKFNEILDHTII